MYLSDSSFVVIEASSIEPVSVEEAKVHCRVAWDDEDDYIAGLITAARQVAEHLTDRVFLATKFRLVSGQPGLGWGWRNAGTRYGASDSGIILPHSPILSVDLVSSVNSDGTFAEIDSNSYRLAGTGRVYPAPGSDSVFFSAPYGIAIEYTAGYGTTPEAIPQTVKNAVLMLVGHYYLNRSQDAPTPRAVAALLDRERAGGYV